MTGSKNDCIHDPATLPNRTLSVSIFQMNYNTYTLTERYPKYYQLYLNLK